MQISATSEFSKFQSSAINHISINQGNSPFNSHCSRHSEDINQYDKNLSNASYRLQNFPRVTLTYYLFFEALAYETAVGTTFAACLSSRLHKIYFFYIRIARWNKFELNGTACVWIRWISPAFFSHFSQKYLCKYWPLHSVNNPTI